MPVPRCPKHGVHRLTATRPCTSVVPFPSALGAGALIIISPIFVGILFGVNSVCGLIAGSIVSSVQVCVCAVWCVRCGVSGPPSPTQTQSTSYIA